MSAFFHDVNIQNTAKWFEEPKPHVQLEQTLTLYSDLDATIIVEQHIDDVTMIEGVRHPLTRGINTLRLKPMRIFNPLLVHHDGTPAHYAISVRIYAAGIEPVTFTENMTFQSLQKDTL